MCLTHIPCPPLAAISFLGGQPQTRNFYLKEEQGWRALVLGVSGQAQILTLLFMAGLTLSKLFKLFQPQHAHL